MRNANIKIWVLTGDKVDTAKNIGFSCKLLTHEGMGLLEYEDEGANLLAATEALRKKVLIGLNSNWTSRAKRRRQDTL